MLANKYLLFAVRAFLGCVFVVAAVDKVAAPEAFAASIAAYKLIPYALVNIIALVVPWLEMLCGVLLLAGVYQRGSAAILSALLAVFMAAMVSALLRELKIDCGCFGKEHATPVSWLKVLEDAGLLVLAVYLWFVPRAPGGERGEETAEGSGG
jgi:putative oxidoreductase